MTIVPEERLIAVDGDFLRFDYEVPAGVHAIQVYDDQAEIEYKDGRLNKIVKGEELQDLIAQYLPLHAAERDRVNSTIPPTACHDLVAGEWVLSLDRLKAARIAQIAQAMDAELAAGVEVDVPAGKIRMDGRHEDVLKLQHGIELAQALGETEIDIVDYYNEVHTGISIADALEIARQQAENCRALWAKKNVLRQQIVAAADEAAVTAVTW
jgi:hypothetical protein